MSVDPNYNPLAIIPYKPWAIIPYKPPISFVKRVTDNGYFKLPDEMITVIFNFAVEEFNKLLETELTPPYKFAACLVIPMNKALKLQLLVREFDAIAMTCTTFYNKFKKHQDSLQFFRLVKKYDYHSINKLPVLLSF